MRKLFLHVGFAKCGSTSLQEALLAYKGNEILYPKSGINGAEHLALPLYVRGVDEWTRQYFDEQWTERGFQALREEIAASDRNVVLSSERLAAASPEEIEKARALFPEFDIEIVFIKRALEKYLSSTWRHAVFYHDYAEPYELFREKMKHFSFDDPIRKYQQRFVTHVFDMDEPDFEPNISSLLGVEIVLPKANVGAPYDFSKLLQETHRLLGSKKFKEVFDMPTKRRMLAVKAGKQTAEIDPLVAKLF